MSRVSLASRMGIREYRRTPILLEILVLAPAEVIVLFSLVVPTDSLTFQIAGGTVVTASYAGVIGALMTPLAGAMIGGITGLFVMQMTRDVDERLVLAGYRPYEVILSRVGMLGSIGVLVTAVAVGALLVMGALVTGFSPASIGWFALATLLTVLVYGMLGALVGSVLDKLAGLYVMLIVPMVDLFLYQNPLGHDQPTFSTYLPGNFPMELAMDAAFTGAVDFVTVVWCLVVLAITTGLATAAFYGSVSVR